MTLAHLCLLGFAWVWNRFKSLAQERPLLNSYFDVPKQPLAIARNQYGKELGIPHSLVSKNVFSVIVQYIPNSPVNNVTNGS